MQQQKLKQQHEEERKRRQQVEKSFISTNNTKISKSATLIAAANAGKIAVGPIPLEIARNNMSTPPQQQQAPIPPYPSPNLQRKDNNLGNLTTYLPVSEISTCHSRVSLNFGDHKKVTHKIL